ncbi:hypothetical protein M4951_08145 [Blastopirellula sp. J2-11]|uniref:hypothetical protein n=1 Tax=Blastopirellula sp. J2-11 TaxID=2943192 RepID=UPI0021C91F93|nr:hypothetical protein [Blastopirellula sp. J2-11]UUO08279.1 hypothetical protein M4951_08145 [Blastopirellula sp. J2-11]
MFHAVGVALIGLLGIGCNNSTGRPLDPGKPIVIQFLYDGVPIPEGETDLSDMGGGTPLTPNGEAIFDHVPFGTYRVVLHPKANLTEVIPPETPPERSAVKRPPKSLIPPKFRDEQTTPLQIEVTEGDADRFEFDLKN